MLGIVRLAGLAGSAGAPVGDSEERGRRSLSDRVDCWHHSNVSIQIFGVKNSQETRAAERFFKERQVDIQMMDLNRKPMAPGEIRRFTDRFGLAALLDTEGKAYVDAGLKYLRMSDAELLARIEREPKLLRLPLIRAGNRVSIGRDEESWKAMIAAAGSLKK
jgi:arsenate reductase (glutaredoxin)